MMRMISGIAKSKSPHELIQVYLVMDVGETIIVLGTSCALRMQWGCETLFIQ